MISSDCDINKFVSSLGDKDYLDIIFLADREATEVERIALQSGYEIGEREKCLKDYADNLKDLICFLKYTVKPKKLTDKFGHLSEKIMQDT
ncbi:MAG: hypothetical protein PVH85_31860 [Desulfobacterales bacterium]|jgi:hypothetical protein